MTKGLTQKLTFIAALVLMVVPLNGCQALGNTLPVDIFGSGSDGTIVVEFGRNVSTAYVADYLSDQGFRVRNAYGSSVETLPYIFDRGRHGGRYEDDRGRRGRGRGHRGRGRGRGHDDGHSRGRGHDKHDDDYDRRDRRYDDDRFAMIVRATVRGNQVYLSGQFRVGNGRWERVDGYEDRNSRYDDSIQRAAWNVLRGLANGMGGRRVYER